MFSFCLHHLEMCLGMEHGAAPGADGLRCLLGEEASDLEHAVGALSLLLGLAARFRDRFDWARRGQNRLLWLRCRL